MLYRLRSATSRFLAPLVLATLSACGDDTVQPTVPGSGGRFQLTKVSGDNQSGLPENFLPEPLRVRLIDAEGDPAPGRRITWTADAGYISPPSTTTDDTGLATVQWTLGDAVKQSATATLEGSGAEPVSFTATVREIWTILVGPDTILIEGAEHQFSAEARAPNRNNRRGGIVETTFTWSSSDPAVATVDSTGRVRGLRAGTTRIYAEASGVRGGAELDVVLSEFLPEQLSVRDWLSCGLLGDGSPYCWGGGVYGELGYEPLQYHWPDYAAPVYPGYRFADIVVGASFTCGRTDAGRVYCSGANTWGRLGVGSGVVSTFTPLPVAGETTFGSLYAGVDHACALTDAGAAYCWGSNPNGQIGDGTHVERYVPTEVPGDLVFEELSLGSRTTCGLTPAGDLYCWGLLPFLEGMPASFVPQRIEVGEPLTSVSVGFDSICGITPQAVLLCWGTNDLGQLGDGSTASTEEPVQVSGAYQNVSVGYRFACAVDLGGSGWCWGRNTVGQLGNGSFDGVSRKGVAHPVPSRIPLEAPLRSIIVDGGKACALSQSQEVYCWGTGALGNDEGMVDCSVNYPEDYGWCRPYPLRVR